MCHNRNSQKQINRIHERALRIVYNDNNSSFEDLLAKSGSVSMHHRNLQLVAIEIYKALNDLSSTLMPELFRVNEKKYNLQNKNALVSNIPHSTNYGINAISHLAPKIWEIIPNEVRCCQSLNLFKEKIKTWIPINVSSVRTTRFGLKGLQIEGAKLWENLPNNIKDIKGKKYFNICFKRHLVNSYEH